MSKNHRLPEWMPSDEENRLQALGYRSPGISLRPSEIEILLDTIEADPNRMSFEKENSILWNSATNVAQVGITDPGLMRRFVLHHHFRLRHITVVTDDSSKMERTMDAEEFRECVTTTNEGPTIESVYSVNGLNPLALLTVGMEPRKSTGHADVVSQNVLENDPRKVGGGFP